MKVFFLATLVDAVIHWRENDQVSSQWCVWPWENSLLFFPNHWSVPHKKTKYKIFRRTYLTHACFNKKGLNRQGYTERIASNSTIFNRMSYKSLFFTRKKASPLEFHHKKFRISSYLLHGFKKFRDYTKWSQTSHHPWTLRKYIWPIIALVSICMRIEWSWKESRHLTSSLTRLTVKSVLLSQ